MSVFSDAKSRASNQQKKFSTSDPTGSLKESFDPGGVGRSLGKTSPYDRSGNKKYTDESNRLNEQEYSKIQEELGKMGGYDKTYYKDMSKWSGDYIKNTTNLKSQAEGQNKIALDEASHAMSLQDAGDPNNKVQQAVRALYDKQAQGVRKQSLQDVGVLNALGAQATAGQLGSAGAPTTGAQLQLLNSNNMAQSGAAYARAQQQMQSLREQGLDRGFSESAAQYDRGQRAIDRTQNLRAEIGNYDNNIFGTQGNLSGLKHGLDTAGSQRQLGAQGAYYDARQGNVNAQMQNYNAQKDVFQSGVNTYMPPYTGPYGGGGGGTAAAAQQKPAAQPTTGQAPNYGAQPQAYNNQPAYGNDPYYNRNYSYGYGYS
jgi:hypothetical protein